MRIENFILSIVKKLEATYPVISFAYKDCNSTNTYEWWWICMTNYEVYVQDKRFKILSDAWRAAAKARGIKIVFCYCSAKEKFLEKLAKEDNLIMNV